MIDYTSTAQLYGLEVSGHDQVRYDENGIILQILRAALIIAMIYDL